MKLCGDQNYNFVETDVRNILMVGRTRTGKTQAIRTLKGVQFTAKPLEIFSETEKVDFRSFSLSGDKGLNYTFNIIDTPGLAEVKPDGIEERDDEKILETISECLKNEIVRLNCIIFFCTLNLGVNDTDVVVMEKLLKYFGNKVNIAVCVTRSEIMPVDERERHKNSLKKHKKMGPILKQTNELIFFMGAIEPYKFKTYGGFT